MDVPKFVTEMAFMIEPVGSRVTCDPPPTDTDEDFLVLVHDNYRKGALVRELHEHDWDLDGSKIADEVNSIKVEERFMSWSRRGVNLIITSSEPFFQRFMAASSVAKRLNLLEKTDRIALFQAVLYGNRCDRETPAPLPADETDIAF